MAPETSAPLELCPEMRPRDMRLMEACHASQALRIGETGFEPATARPPARPIRFCGLAFGSVEPRWCSSVALSCAHFAPRNAPRTGVRLSLREVQRRACLRERRGLLRLPLTLSDSAAIGRATLASSRCSGAVLVRLRRWPWRRRVEYRPGGSAHALGTRALPLVIEVRVLRGQVASRPVRCRRVIAAVP